jgi:dTDP-4-amino-4,6-dideoxygalactose transaminase
MLKEKVKKIEFIDLQAQRRAMGENIPHVIEQVLVHGSYILGPEVQKLEEELIRYTGAQDAITCSNGTDALRLLLLAYNVGPGDAVLVPTFTFASTAEVVAEAKATPIFVDICKDTFNMDIQSIESALKVCSELQLNPKGIIAVDLFGLPADYTAIQNLASRHNMWVIADSCQSFGGAIGTKKVGNLAQTTATSFFPSKPLACYGDGGAIFTNDQNMSELMRSLRNHGCGKDRYNHLHIGLNSRLDTIQAAILLEKLKIFPQELVRRNEIASFYNSELKSVVQVPFTSPDMTHAYGLYTIACENTEQREHIIKVLQSHDIPSNVYYRKPLHHQPAYLHFPRATEQLLAAESACDRVLSLPMHPYLSNEQLEYIVHYFKEALR